MSIDSLISVLGWMSVINIGMLIFSAGVIVLLRPLISRLHASMFEISPIELNTIYFNFLGWYKLAIIMLNIVPYLALKIVFAGG